MTITFNQERVKLSTTFSHPAAKSVIASFLNNTTLPKLQTIVINKLQANFTDFTINHKDFRLGAVSTITDGWEATGKMLLSGTTELASGALITGYDDTIDNLLTEIELDVVNNGGTLISSHIHHWDIAVDVVVVA